MGKVKPSKKATMKIAGEQGRVYQGTRKSIIKNVRDKVAVREVLGSAKIREVLRTGTYASFFLEPLPSNKQGTSKASSKLQIAKKRTGRTTGAVRARKVDTS
jgi:hypothetical protein